MNDILKIENLSHSYNNGKDWAVKDVTISISTPGVYGLLGVNGAGKSTIMGIICGIFKQSVGHVQVLGTDIKKSPLDSKRNIGFLPQDPPVYGDLTVEEYLKFAAALRLMPDKKIQEAVETVLETCKIRHFRKRLIKNLSGGYRQRVGIAQAIIHEPSLVIFDEPTNGLDPNQILEIRKLLKKIAENRTVILSTHILSEVQAACDYIWMLHQGELVFDGSVDQFDNYITTSSFIINYSSTMPSLDDLVKLSGVLNVKQVRDSLVRVSFSDYQLAVNSILKFNASYDYQLKELYLEKHSLETIFAALSQSKLNTES